MAGRLVTIPDPGRMLTARDVADAVIWMASTAGTAVPTEVLLDPAGHGDPARKETCTWT